MVDNCCAPQQPCPNCGYCPCCGRGRYGFVPYQPYYPPYPQPVWIGTGGYVQPSTTGTPLPLPSITVAC
jgi:hypothetical protein